MHKAKNIYFLLSKKNEMAQGRVPSPTNNTFCVVFSIKKALSPPYIGRFLEKIVWKACFLMQICQKKKN